MSILLEAAGVGPTYSTHGSIDIPADGGRFVSLACEFVFHRRTASEVDELVAEMKRMAAVEADDLADQATMIDLVLDQLVSMTVKARGKVKEDKVLEDRDVIRAALDVAGVPMQVFSIWAGSQQKAKRGN